MYVYIYRDIHTYIYIYIYTYTYIERERCIVYHVYVTSHDLVDCFVECVGLIVVVNDVYVISC